MRDQKADIRKTALAARKEAHAAGLGPALTRALLDAIGPVAGDVVAGYMPIRTEADPLPAMTALAERTPVCVPVIEAAGQPLSFRQWHPSAPMVDGPFGARVPETGAWLQPRILIVPLVAFDARLNRLGYGGGFYDRTLERLRRAGPVTAIGLAFAAQQVALLPIEPTDQPLDGVVTENGALARPARSA